MTLLQALQSANAYPAPLAVFETAAAARGLDLAAEAAADAFLTKEYRLVLSDIFMWLSEAPNVSQGGQTYSFDEEQRLRLRNRAAALRKGCETAEELAAKPLYGYKGGRL